MGKAKRRFFRLGAGVLILFLAVCGPAAAAEQNPVATEDVVVTATKTGHRLEDVPVPTEVITRKEIENRQAKTLQEALNGISGLNVTMDGGSWGNKGKVSIRGLESKHVLVLVDGHRVYGGHSASVDLQSYPTAMIERIEVVKGPGSALYGSEAMGGVINIITRKAEEKTRFTASAAAGSRDRRVMEAVGSFKGKRAGSLLNYTYKHSDGVEAKLDEYKEQALQGTLDYELSPRSEISLKPYFSEHTIDYENRIQQRIGLNPSWRWEPDDLSTFQAAGSWFSYDHESEDEETGETDTDYTHDVYELELNYSRLVFGRHLVTTGSHLELEERDDQAKGYDADEQVLSFFVSDEIDLAPFVLVMGARLDDHDQWGTEVAPKLNISWRATDSVKLHGSVGRGFNAPTLSKLYGQWRMGPFLVQPNPDLKPEESVGYEIGAEWQATSRLTLSAALFQNDVDKLIVSKTRRSGPPPWDLVWENVDEARTRGVEAGVEIKLFENWTADVAYTYLDTENRITGNELEERPNHRIDISMAGRWPSAGLSVFLEGRYTGRRYADAGNEDRLGGYTLVDLTVNKDLGNSCQAFIRFDNLLGKKGIEDAYDVDGTEILAGISVTL
ncbi:MAG: TonB-dependent receptor [Desulfobacteraceae bacterium]